MVHAIPRIRNIASLHIFSYTLLLCSVRLTDTVLWCHHWHLLPYQLCYSQDIVCYHSPVLNSLPFLPVAQLTKTQRQKLGFNLKVRKAKQSAIGSYLYLNPKW